MEYQFKVKGSERGKRLENFLYEKMGDWSHKKIKTAIDKKRVFVNGKNIFIAGWNLKGGDKVIFRPQNSDFPVAPEVSRYQFVQVLFEDPYLLITNKPAFVDYDSFIIQVNAYIKRIRGAKFYPYLGQVHRLDKETSGILMFTKKKSANVIADQFREHRIRKYYWAVVSGQVQKDHGVIDTPIEKGKFEGGRKAKIAEEGEGKESYTEYWVKERYSNATFLKILLRTGRTHQIRIHLSSMGYPLIGDKLYAREVGTIHELPLQDLGRFIKRHALHAYRIEFTHPVTHKKISVESPLPPDMVGLIDELRTLS